MTTENNKIIAEFMGFIITEDKVIIPKIYESEESPFSLLRWIDDFREVDNLPPNSLNNLHFHSDWNWLMEVVEKIESLNYTTSIYHLPRTLNTVKIFSGGADVIGVNGETKIQAVYNACIEFVKWYNEISAKEN